MPHPIFLIFNVTTMGAAWKKSTPEGLRPPQYSESGGAPGCEDIARKTMGGKNTPPPLPLRPSGRRVKDLKYCLMAEVKLCHA